jgi:ankyrin repeat protein
MSFQFWDIVQEGTVEQAKAFLASYEPTRRDPETKQEVIHFENDYALVIATELNKHVMVQYLIEELGLKPTAECFNIACFRGFLDLVKYFFSYCGLAVNSNHNEAVISAAQGNHMDVVQFLLEKGADIRDQEDLALIYASENGHYEMVSFLLKEKKANPKARDSKALSHACAFNYTLLIDLLLEYGADVKDENNLPILKACFYGHLNIVKHLIHKGADPHARGHHTFIWAAARGHIHVMKFLAEEMKCDPRAENDRALVWAAEAGKTSAVEFLAELGVPLLNVEAAWYALCQKHYTVFEKLIENEPTTFLESHGPQFIFQADKEARFHIVYYLSSRFDFSFVNISDKCRRFVLSTRKCK